MRALHKRGGCIVSEDKKTDKLEKKVSSVDTETEILTSGDSGPLDLQLYRYIGARIKIVTERRRVETDINKQKLLEEEFFDLKRHQSLLVQKTGQLYGNCYRVSNLLRIAQQINELPRNKENPDKVRDNYTQIKRDFELIKSWDGSIEQLTTVIPTSKSSSSPPVEEKTSPHQETLEDVFERISSYVFQLNPSITQLIPGQTKPLQLEVAGAGGKILHPDPNAIATVEFTCHDAHDLSEVLAKFSDRLLPEEYRTTLTLMPIYVDQECNLLLNTTGHRINVWMQDQHVHVKDQTVDAQFLSNEYEKIAKSIFSTRQKLYVQTRGAIGFVMQFCVYNPLKIVDEKLSDKPETKKSTLSYPSSQEILAKQAPRHDYENSSLLLLALKNGNLALADALLKQTDIDVNVLEYSGRSDTSLWMALKSNRLDIVKKLLEKGADLNKLDNKGNSIFDFLLSDAVTQTYFEGIVNIPAVFNHRNQGYPLLYMLIHITMDKAAAGINPSPASLAKISWLATQQEKMSVSSHGKHILAKTTTELFTDYIKQGQLYTAVYTAHYFRKQVTFDYKKFVDLYLNTLPPEQQYQALSELASMLQHNPDAVRIIILTAFNDALFDNNDLLRDAILKDNPNIINIRNKNGHTPLDVATVEQDEAVVLFLLSRKNIQLTDTLKKIDNGSLPTTRRIRSMIEFAARRQSIASAPTPTLTTTTSSSSATHPTTAMTLNPDRESKHKSKPRYQPSTDTFFQIENINPQKPHTEPNTTSKSENKRIRKQEN